MTHVAYRNKADGPLFLWVYDFEEWLRLREIIAERQVQGLMAGERRKAKEQIVAKDVENIGKGPVMEGLRCHEVVLVSGGYNESKVWVWKDPSERFNGKCFREITSPVEVGA
jgi:hypothetical protein